MVRHYIIHHGFLWSTGRRLQECGLAPAVELAQQRPARALMEEEYKARSARTFDPRPHLADKSRRGERQKVSY